jgi:predicted phosphodiesterase
MAISKDFRPRLGEIHTEEQELIGKLLAQKIRDLGLAKSLELLGQLPSSKKMVHSSKGQKWIVLSDIHRPFHNQALWSKVLRLIKDMGTDLHGVVLAGDYLDLYTLGSYNSMSLGLLEGIDLGYEYEDGLNGLIELQSVLPAGCRKLFLYGNHEDRYFRTMNSRDHKKFGSALRDPIEALRLHENGWEVKTNWKDDFLLGEHLDICHGTYHNKHVAAKHLDQNGRSVMFGHTHRIQSYHLGNRAAFNIGGLFDIKNKAFGYMPRMTRRNWANGFAIVNIDDNGDFYVNQITVWNDCFFAEGRKY